MTDHALLDQVIDSLLAEQGAMTPVPTQAKSKSEHWLRRTLKTGPVQLPPPRR